MCVCSSHSHPRPLAQPESPRSSQGQKRFDQPLDGWDVSRVTNMNYMFRRALKFNQPLPWNVSRLAGTYAMFQGASEFNSPLINWDVSSLTTMGVMFDATKFNQPLAWNIASLTGAEARSKRSTPSSSPCARLPGGLAMRGALCPRTSTSSAALRCVASDRLAVVRRTQIWRMP